MSVSRDQAIKAKLELLQEIINGFIDVFSNSKELMINGIYTADSLKVVYSQAIISMTAIEGFVREYLLKEF